MSNYVAAEVREVFRSTKFGNIAGVIVTHGTFNRTDPVRILRGGERVEGAHDLEVASLRRYKDDLTEAEAGLECGIGLGTWDDVRVGDTIQQYPNIWQSDEDGNKYVTGVLVAP